MKRNGMRRATTTGAAALGIAAAAGVIGAAAVSSERDATRIADELTHLAPFDVIAPASLDPGERLIAELNCIACHAAPQAIAERLDSRKAPLLGQVGQRFSPDYLRAWLADPHKVKPGATMPNLMTGIEPGVLGQMAEPLVHFLVSLGGIARPVETPFNETDVNRGRVLYHQVGCVACHAPREAPAVLNPTLKPAGEDPYGAEQGLPTEIPDGAMEKAAPLGSFAQTNIESLTDLLLDPAKIRPSGRMPAMNLTKDEARAIATYLIATDVEKNPQAAVQAPFTLNPAKVASGQRMFAQLGCAHCHEMGPNRTEVKPQRPMPFTSFLELKHLDKGCLAAEPEAMVANYNLTAEQRQLIRETLGRARTLSQPLSEAQTIDRTLATMNCYACHARDGQGGPVEARRPYFMTMGEAELGDEGRFPPPLTGVGGKLRTAWMTEVISSGAKVRPYMATRMPVFQTVNAEVLAAKFEKVDAPCPAEDLPPMAFSSQLAADGRRLAGTERGMSCINCHSIKGSEPIGEPAMDLVSTHERLRSDWFHTYMLDPAKLRPGTRMPNHWPPDQANPFPDVQDGDPDRQIDAIWAYLSQGEFLALPEGVPEEGGYDILVRDEPVVFRTFIKGAGARAIGIGFKEQVHLAFDSEKCRVTEIWRGPFLNASGAWAGRGGNATDPGGADVVKPADEFPFKTLQGNGDMTMTQPTPEFRGYRFDQYRQPILQYSFDDWSIEEQPLPIVRPAAPGLRRIFDVKLAPGRAGSPGLAFEVAIGEHIEMTGRDQYNVDGRVTYDVLYPDTAVLKVIHYQDADHLVLLFGNSNISQAHFELGMTW